MGFRISLIVLAALGVWKSRYSGFRVEEIWGFRFKRAKVLAPWFCFGCGLGGMTGFGFRSHDSFSQVES